MKVLKNGLLALKRLENNLWLINSTHTYIKKMALTKKQALMPATSVLNNLKKTIEDGIDEYDENRLKGMIIDMILVIDALRDWAINTPPNYRG